MGIKQYNPVTAGRRGASVSDFAELTKGAAPEKSLLRPYLFVEPTAMIPSQAAGY